MEFLCRSVALLGLLWVGCFSPWALCLDSSLLCPQRNNSFSNAIPCLPSCGHQRTERVGGGTPADPGTGNLQWSLEAWLLFSLQAIPWKSIWGKIKDRHQPSWLQELWRWWGKENSTEIILKFSDAAIWSSGESTKNTCSRGFNGWFGSEHCQQ